MKLFSTRLGPKALRGGVATMCGLIVLLAATPARGQCDPQELAKLIASDAAVFDSFGNSVALSGDTAVVGAWSDDDAGSLSGSAYVFVLSGGVWTQQAKLTASDGAFQDRFGNSVAVSGDTVVVGAYADDHVNGSFNNEGSAYVFVRTGSVWTQQAKLTASDAAVLDDFGISVAVSGDTAVVGAWKDDYPHMPFDIADGGSAYVFVRSGGVWTQQAKLTASDAGSDNSGDLFGIAVAVEGDTAVVGARDANVPHTGAAYVFTRTGEVWTEQAKLVASDGEAADFFGIAVALSGDTAVIGTVVDSAYVFIRSGEVWTEQQKLTASDATTGDGFGLSVAVEGDTAVVGALLEEGPTDPQAAGAAYLFTRTGSVWTEQAKLKASDPSENANFGATIALDGDTALIGAGGDDPLGITDAGSAYVFDVNCSACSGDTDGDGDVDLSDLGVLLAAFGACSGDAGYDATADFDANGCIDLSDLGTLLSAYGVPCP